MEFKKILNWKFLISLVLPFAALFIQLKFQALFKPTIWFLFYPAIFLASWVGGLTAGVLVTLISVLLVKWFLIEPLYSFQVINAAHLIVMLTFTVTGFVFSLTHYFYKKQVQDNTLTSEELEKLKLQGRQLQMAVESARIGTWSWDLVEKKIMWSDTMYKLFGVPSATEIDLKKFFDCLHPKDRHSTSEAIEKSLGSGSNFEIEYRVVWPDESIHWIVAVGRSHQNKDKVPIRMEGIVRDIDARKLTEIQLREEKERLVEAQHIALIATWKFELDGSFKWSNELYSLMGVNIGMLDKSNQSLEQLFYPDDQYLFHNWFEACLAGKQPSSILIRRYFADGQLKYLSIRGELHFGIDGMPDYILGTVQDVSEQFKRDQLLRANEERHRFALELLAIGEWELDLKTNEVTHNLRHSQIFGYEDLYVGWNTETFFSHVIPEEREYVRSQFTTAIEKNVQMKFECRIRRIDGNIRWIQAGGQKRILAPHKEVFVGIVSDITEQKQYGERLKESEARFRSLFEHLPIAYQSLDKEGHIIDANQYLAEILGFKSFLDLLGRSFIYFFDQTNRISFEAAAALLKESKALQGEYHLRRFDGKLVIIDVASRIQIDTAGNFICAHYIVIDVTERRSMEAKILELNQDLEKKVQDRTRQLADANAAKSLFLASMSHEIRTPLNAVLGLAEVLYEDGLTGDQKEIIHKISLSGKSLLNIINDILDFSKIEAGQLSLCKQPFYFEEILDQLKSVMSVAAKVKGLNFNIVYQKPIPGLLLGDSQRIGQIFLNLAGNAVKFTEKGGITIRISPVTMSDQLVLVRFEIEDTGVGIKPEILDNLFHPFVQADNTITRRFGGTGLGLSISKRLVEIMGGKIGATSVYGKGSLFWFELELQRIKSDSKSVSEKLSSVAELKNRLVGIRVLVADDSQDNLYLAERMLSKFGAQVTLVDNGSKVCELLKEQPQAFDVVLMDIQMPIMDGLAATQQIRRDLKLTELPIIALSAGVLPEERQTALESGMNDFLPKPTDSRIMIEMILSLIARKVMPEKPFIF